MSMRACSMSLWAGALAAHLTLTSLRPRTCTCHGAPCQVGLLAAVFNPNPNPSPNPEQVGFLAAVFNNGIDCVQNVFSKRLMTESLTPVSAHPLTYSDQWQPNEFDHSREASSSGIW